MAGVTNLIILSLVLCGPSSLRAEEPIRLEGDFEAQVREIIDRRQLKAEGYKAINDAVDTMKRILQTRWPEAKLTPFGSVRTGLATINSDIDVYAYIPYTENNTRIDEETASILRQYPEHFSDIQLQGTRIPTVSGVHLPSRRNFDLSFTGPSGVRNTELTSYLLNGDSKILNLAKIIKYWTNVQKLDRDFTQYLFTLMEIFFLQQKDILPPLADLQKNVKPLMMDHWNTAFEERLISPTNEELFDLLVDFFKYYAKFDYDNYVISPFVGYPVSRAKFEDVNSLPEEFKLYKNNVANNITSPVCFRTALVVQDAFEHNRGLSQDDNASCLLDFYY